MGSIYDMDIHYRNSISIFLDFMVQIGMVEMIDDVCWDSEDVLRHRMNKILPGEFLR